MKDHKGLPVVPLLLIAVGVIFLLNNLDIVHMRQLLPYLGPSLLIGLGIYMLIMRLRENADTRPHAEAPHER